MGRQLMADAKYGHDHQKLRAEWKRKVDAGGVHCAAELHGHPCVMPETIIHPGSKWALGHYDEHIDPEQVMPPAPEHFRCNAKAPSLWKQRALAPKEDYQWFT